MSLIDSLLTPEVIRFLIILGGAIVVLYLIEEFIKRLQNATKAAIALIGEVVTGLVLLAALLGIFYIGFALFGQS